MTMAPCCSPTCSLTHLPPCHSAHFPAHTVALVRGEGQQWLLLLLCPPLFPPAVPEVEAVKGALVTFAPPCPPVERVAAAAALSGLFGWVGGTVALALPPPSFPACLFSWIIQLLLVLKKIVLRFVTYHESQYFG